MFIDISQDPELLQYISRSQPLDFQDIVKFAKARGAKTPQDLWDFHDLLQKAWSEKKSTEGSWT